MAKKKPAGGSDIPEWLVTFADLMSILVAFFVLLISFSIQDQDKSGVIEKDGNPERKYLRQVSNEDTEAETEFSDIDHDEKSKQGSEANTFDIERSEVEHPEQFSLAAATLKQAWQDLPEITYVSDNLIVQDTKEGTNIVIADQTGRAMFPEGSKYPFEQTRKAIAAMAPILAKMPNQIRITGHTAAGTKFTDPRYGRWELSADRANAVRAILEEFGLPSERFFSVVGRGDAEPFFPNDPFLATNQRVSILLVQEKPPVPTGLKP